MAEEMVLQGSIFPIKLIMKTGAPSQKENHFSQNSFQKHIALHTLGRMSPVYMIQLALHKRLSLGEHSEEDIHRGNPEKTLRPPPPLTEHPQWISEK